jgi:hypothetical protein
MKWFAIAGAWRKTNREIEDKVRETVRSILREDGGIISGGALGVDYIATEEALKNNVLGSRLKIFIPSSLEIYTEHYFKRAEEGIVTKEQAGFLINQLKTVKELGSLVEGVDTELNKETYFNRITEIIREADELVAFHVNKSEGTQDTINKAKKKGIPFKVYEYEIN